MDDDDDFGDLYADIGPEQVKGESEYGTREGAGNKYEDDDEELLYGSSSIALATTKTLPLAASAVQSGTVSAEFELGEKDVDNEEILLYGKLYGSSSKTSRNAASRVSSQSKVEESALRPTDKTGSERTIDDILDSGVKDLTGTSVEDGKSFLFGIRERGGKASFPSGVDAIAVKTSSLEGHRNPISIGESGVSQGSDLHRRSAAEGSEHESGGLYLEEEATERDGGSREGAPMGGITGEEGDDWDSDSEDDLQIVLNDEAPAFNNLERAGEGEYVEGSEDEDEEDLVIVAGDEPLEPEREWGEDAPLSLEAPLPGPPNGAPILATDKPTGVEDRGPAGKAGGSGASPGVPRIGYSGQGYHTQSHHSQYKYVRPGAATAGVATSTQAGAPQGAGAGGRGGGVASGWGQGRGTGTGRGDWGGGGRGSSGSQRVVQSSAGPWTSAGRGYSNGMEFNLPPTKSVFDIDLDSLEDKPWRRPGVDPTDYFNFGFIESTWKQYCRQLAQLRLEATMQSKIRVYESGRSEQEYDPDLPPELAAAASMQDGSGDFSFPQQRQPDSATHAGGAGRGRGTGRGRSTIPTGRAIQVDGGGGERRPSSDIRRRTRDSDAVIQIVLQDAADDEPVPPSSMHHEEYREEDERGGPTMEQVPPYRIEDEPRDFRPGAPGPWVDFYPHPEPWESDNMGMGMGMRGGPMHGMGLRPALHMVVEGPGPFPRGPGMPMGPPGPGPEFGPGPDFGMFPGGPFGLPPGGRGGMGRPPMYGGPRPGMAPLPGPGPGILQENFPPRMLPMDFHEPLRRRTPPNLMTPPRGVPPVEWEEEHSNGSGANWSGREPQSIRESREHESPSREYEVETRVAARRSISTVREKSVDEPSVEGRSEDRKRSAPKEQFVDEDSWEPSDTARASKKAKVSAPKAEREESSHVKTSLSESSGEGSDSSWEQSKEQFDGSDEISQPRRQDVSRSRPLAQDGSPYEELDGYRPPKSNSMRSSRRDEERERWQPNEREESQRRNVKDDNIRERRGRDMADRDRLEREDGVRTRRDKAREREEEARRRERAEEYRHRKERVDVSWKRERDDAGHRRRLEEMHGEKAREEDRVGRNSRTRQGAGDDEAWFSREREGTRAREEGRPRAREGSRVREERVDREEDHSRGKTRHEDLRGRGKDRTEDSRVDRRGHREKELRVREERKRNDDVHEQKRAWEGLGRDIVIERNGSHSGDKNHRVHSDGSKRHKNDEHHQSAHNDKDQAAEVARHVDRKALPSKRSQESSKRGQDIENARRLVSIKGEKSVFSESESSGDEDETERRGRSKLERWTSRKERDLQASMEVDKRQGVHHSTRFQERRPQEAPSTSQRHTADRRQDHLRVEQQAAEHILKERKDKQRTAYVSKRHANMDADKDGAKVERSGNGTSVKKDNKHPDMLDVNNRKPGEDLQQSQPTSSVSAAVLEKRKERFGRLKKQATDNVSKREENNSSTAQPLTVEVKQERPARKRRWGGGNG